MPRLLRPVIVLWVIPALLSLAQANKSGSGDESIRQEEVGRWLNQKFDCPSDAPPYFWRFDYFDFNKDGSEQAIVVASTCETGTAGPDVHSVIARDSQGKLVEWKIDEVDPKTFDNLFGNRNSTLAVEDGLLVATYHDDIERETPIVIQYKWNGQEFAVVSIKKTGVYRTSYDCTGTLNEVENAICHVEELADLDLELRAAYKAALAGLPAAERDALRSEQRNWIAERNKCQLYKSWVGLLSDLYTKRIEELKKRIEPVAVPATRND
jgi:uncharacterized protein YecT (DUF1311 family)